VKLDAPANAGTQIALAPAVHSCFEALLNWNVRSHVMEQVETSVADALSRAHAALLKDLRELEQAGRAGEKNYLKSLPARLQATRVHIVEHFQFEEESGYMDAVRKHEPRLERVVQQLADEHLELLSSLDALIAETAAGPSSSEALAAKVSGWIKTVQQHEARENHLVQEVFSLDLGAED
jgi:hypothetical protein